MALTKTISVKGCHQFAYPEGLVVTESDATFSIKDAYIVVYTVTGNKESAKITVHCRGNDIALTRFYEFKPSVEEGSDNFIKQAYEYLKTLPEYANATDC
jgi:predicted choloylglycine hydrolase